MVSSCRMARANALGPFALGRACTPLPDGRRHGSRHAPSVARRPWLDPRHPHRRVRAQWQGVRGSIDAPRFAEVDSFLTIQEMEARWWRDAALQYFASFSHIPLRAGVEPPAHSLEHYMALRCPSDPPQPRCPEIQ